MEVLCKKGEGEGLELCKTRRRVQEGGGEECGKKGEDGEAESTRKGKP